METEEERRERRRMRIEEMKREKRRAQLLYKGIGVAAAAAVLGGVFWGVRGIPRLRGDAGQELEENGKIEGDGRAEGDGKVAGDGKSEGNGKAEGDGKSGGAMGGNGQFSAADGVRRKSEVRRREGVLPAGSQGAEPVPGGGPAVGEGGVPGGMWAGGAGATGMPGSRGGVGLVLGGMWGGQMAGGALGGTAGVGGLPGGGQMAGGALGGTAGVGGLPWGGQTAGSAVGVGPGGLSGAGAAAAGASGGMAAGSSGVGPAPGGLSSGGLPGVGQTAVFTARTTADTKDFDESIISRYGIVVDAAEGVILAQKDARERMNPASMTKILTVLVAAEHLSEEDLEETAEITIDITDYCYVNECSITGYDLGETVPVRDLFYGTILPSGADSALALAVYVAGSHEAFVELMNEKLEELGLAQTTHFTNCVGLYDENHYSTAYDMAVILKTAVDNAFCREVLSAHIYTTSLTEQHPEGLRVSNWFLRRIEDRETHGEVLCGKTGFVNESGSCAASFCLGNDGGEYLCVTAGSASAWKCIDDQAALYRSVIAE